MTDVRADRRGAGQADLGVHVGAVHVDLAAMLVNHRADVPDVLFEHAVRRGVGHHQRRQLVAMLPRLGAQVLEVDVALAVARRHHHPQPRHRRARRVGAVRRRRNQDDVALALAGGLLVGADGHQAGELALSAGVGLQRHGREPGDPAERLFQLAEHLRVSLGLLARHEGMDARELRPGNRQHLGGGVQLHRARAERDHRRVEADVLPLEPADVAHHLGFRMMRVEDRMGQVLARSDQRRRRFQREGRAAADRRPHFPAPRRP